MARQRKNDPEGESLTNADLARRMKSGARRKLEDRLWAAGWNRPRSRSTAAPGDPRSPAGDASASDLP